MIAAATSYVISYLVFAYVDIAWDVRSMIFLAVALAVAADLPPLLPELGTAVAPDGQSANRRAYVATSQSRST